ncbi:MAG: MarR family transcriptional regulator [Sulfitobacter sp.]|nr:MarR family transcriptional regulator [Sulfitobacter sp.]
MPDDSIMVGDPNGAVSKHPPVSTVEDVITFRLQRLVTIGDRAGNQWFERLFDLTLNEWRLLALIVAHAPARAGDMADLLYMDKSQLSRVIKSLQSKGLIRNATDPNDGRAVALKPTGKGKKLYTTILEEVLRSNERVLAPLTAEEVAVFDSLLGKLIDHNSALLEARLANK